MFDAWRLSQLGIAARTKHREAAITWTSYGGRVIE